MGVIHVTVFCSIFGAIFANPLNPFDQTFLDLFKLKQQQQTKPKIDQKLTLFGEPNQIRNWDVQNIDMGKPITKPYSTGMDQYIPNRYPLSIPAFDPSQNKLNAQTFTPYSEQKESPQFPPPEYLSTGSSLGQAKSQDPTFPDPESMAMQSFSGDINTAALHAMNLRNPSMAGYEMKNFLRDPADQQKMQQNREFSAVDQDPVKMVKKPTFGAMIDAMNFNSDPLQMRKMFNQPTRGNQRENLPDFTLFQGRPQIGS